MFKKFIYKIIAIPFSLIAFSNANAENDCFYKQHSFQIESKQHYDAICNISIDVIQWFEDKGYSDTDLEIKVILSPAIIIPFFDDNGSVTAEAQVFGLYNVEDNLVVMTQWESPYIKQRTAWLTDATDVMSGLDISYKLWLSILSHEIAHQVFQQIWKNQNKNLAKNIFAVDGGLHEFVAYSVQLELMDNKTRETVLNQYPNAIPFPIVSYLNSSLHYYHPHHFGVRSYLSMIKHPEWFHLIVDGTYTNFLIQL